MSKWVLKRSKVNIKKMAEALGVSEFTAYVLANRGIGTYNDGIKFIETDMSFLYPAKEFKDMEKGLCIIADSIKSNKKIAVYGDYDVDGVMSTVILYKALKACGADVIYHIPHRQKEGYGLNMDTVVELGEYGINTMLTCDNGIAAIEEIKKAKELGMKVVIIDHHEPGFYESEGIINDIIPCADAVIDPKQRECTYRFNKLCAAGIAFKFAKSLFEYMNISFDCENEYLTLAAVATVCDIVDLLDENRIIVKKGLKYINSTSNIGLKTLIHESGLDEVLINEYHLGYVIGPCINATGRLESAEAAVKLFSTCDTDEAEMLANELVELNKSRKEMTQMATEVAIKQIEDTDLKNDNILVVYCGDIHESIAGIVAGRIKEKYYKPTIVITKSEQMAKGSARSIEGYNIFEELYKCRDLFHKFGGHPMAAGLSLEYENIGLLRNRLNESCKLSDEDFIDVIKIECQIKIGDISFDLANELNGLSPFGKGNPAPIFGCKNICVEKISLIGKNKDIIRFSLLDKDTNKRIAGISFDGYENLLSIADSLYVNILNIENITFDADIVFRIDINDFNGRKSLQLMIKDFRLCK